MSGSKGKFQRFNLYSRLVILVPVDGGYTEWTEWGDCSQLCGGGTQYRTRECTNPSPSDGGDDCSSLGAHSESQDCNTHTCGKFIIDLICIMGLFGTIVL